MLHVTLQEVHIMRLPTDVHLPLIKMPTVRSHA